MAGAGYKLFQTGDVLTAAQVNTYLNEQTVMVFANAAARTSALTSVLAEGMVSYLQDTNAVEVYNGSAWVGVSGAGDVTEVQAGTGISVASGTGPIPVVTNTMATAIDAKGDLVVGTGADTFSRLAVGGTNGHTLQVDSSTATGLKWAAAAAPTFAGCSLSNTGSQGSVATSTWTAITWSTEDFDTDAFHSTATNTSRITIPSGKAGKYQINGAVQYNDNTTGYRVLAIYVNGVKKWEVWCPADANYPHNTISQILNLAENDYVELFVWQNSGNTLTIYANNGGGIFSAGLLGA